MQSVNNSSASHILNGCESADDLSGSGTNAKDLPIDPLWEKQQKKTFTAWCNAHLRKVNIQIEDIGEDFRDGLKLMRLLEVISNESLPKPEKGKLRLHHVNNVNKALTFIASKGVKLVSIGAEEIVDGNIKMTLGMIWTVILRFAIQNISYEDISAKEGLLLWCQRQTKGYQNVNVLNFHHSFKDGLAFCALIHKHRPDLIDYSELKQSNHAANLNLAFDVAEEKLDIPRMLDAEDMVTPDEKSVMAYVSSYYHCFSTGRQLGVAATRISKAVSVHRENQALKEEYELLSKELIDWINRKTADFQCTEEKDDMSEVQQLMDVMRSYRKSEKPQKLEDKAKLESNYNTLQTRLRLSGRQPFIPSADYTIVRIEALWKVLETTEHTYELWLERELTRLKNMNHLLNKFYVKVRSHEAWSHDKPVQLSDVEIILSSTQGELRAMTKRHEAFCSDLLARAARVHRITALCAELQELECAKAQEVQAKTDALLEEWELISRLSEERKQHIARVLPILERLDEFHLQFAKKAGPFDSWMQQAEEDLEDNFIIHSAEEVTALEDAHQLFRESLSEAKAEFDDLENLAAKVEQVARENSLAESLVRNPYTHVSAQGLSERWNSVQELEAKRSQLLQSAAQKQREIGNLQQHFAKLAQQLDSSLEEALKQCHAIGISGEGTLELQLSSLQQLASQSQFDSQLDALEKCDKQLEDYFVFERSQTPLSLDKVRIKYGQLKSNLKTTMNQIENQILTRDSKGLTQVQMDEYRKCFNHFDRDRTQRLEPNEFKALLVSLEYSIASGDHKSGEADFARVLQSADTEGRGFVTFESFVDFMTKEMSDQDSENQLLESFRLLAGEKGHITEEDLRRDLPPEDAEYCIKQMKKLASGNEDKLDFQSFTKVLYG